MNVYDCNWSELTKSVSSDSIKLTDVMKYVERCAFYAGIDDDLKFDCVNVCRVDHRYTLYIPVKQGYCLDFNGLIDFKDYLMRDYEAYLFVHSDGEIEVNLS